MNNNIEEDIERSKILLEDLAEYGLSHAITEQEVQAIENILADRERYKQLYEKALSDVVRLSKKANKYDSLVEKIKNEIDRLRRIHEDRDFTSKEAFYLDCHKELLDTVEEEI